MDTAAILELIKETAEKVINPRFRALEQADVESKTSPDDLGGGGVRQSGAAPRTA